MYFVDRLEWYSWVASHLFKVPRNCYRSASRRLTKSIFILASILITGGRSGYRLVAELFTPLDNRTCQLPTLPDDRVGHVQSGNMICGGQFTRRSCIKWSGEQGAWVILPVNLTQERLLSSVWSVSQDQSLVIMGSYSGAARETSETVSSDGVSTRPSFNMKYPTWWDYQ